MEGYVSEISSVFVELFRCVELRLPLQQANSILAELSRVLLTATVDRRRLARFAELPEKLDFLLDSVYCESSAHLALQAAELSATVCQPPLGHAHQTALRFAAMCQSETQLQCCVSALKTCLDCLECDLVTLKAVLESGACRVASRILLCAASNFSIVLPMPSENPNSEIPQKMWFEALDACLEFLSVVLDGARGCAADAASRLVSLSVPNALGGLLDACAQHQEASQWPIEDADARQSLLVAALLDTGLSFACASQDGAAAMLKVAPLVKLAADRTAALESTHQVHETDINGTACALASKMLGAQSQHVSAELLAVDSLWPVLLCMRLDAAIHGLQMSHLDDIAQQRGLSIVQSALAGLDTSCAGLDSLIVVKASAGGVMHQVSQCLHNLDEGVMEAAIKTLAVILVGAFSVRVHETTLLRLWQQLSTERIVPALVACTADYNPRIRKGAFACLQQLANCAAQHWSFLVQGQPLLDLLGQCGVLQAAAAAVRLWAEADGDLESACEGAQILALFASTEQQGGLDPAQWAQLVADLTLCLACSAQKCWKVSQRDRRWRRQHADLLRSQDEEPSSAVQRVRRRSRGYSSSPVSPERVEHSHSLGAQASDGSPLTSSSDEAELNPGEAGDGLSCLLAASALALGNCFLFQPYLRMYAVQCGLLPLLLRLLQGSFCSAMYNGGRKRCERDQVGFLSQTAAGSNSPIAPAAVWQPLVNEASPMVRPTQAAEIDIKALCTDDEWLLIAQRADGVQAYVSRSEDSGSMLLSSAVAPDTSTINVLTCLTNLCADFLSVKDLMIVPSMFKLLFAVSNSASEHIRMLACLLLAHLSISPKFALPKLPGLSCSAFDKQQLGNVLALLETGAKPPVQAASLWSTASVAASTTTEGLEVAALGPITSLNTYLHGVVSAGISGIVQPTTASQLDGATPPSSQCQAAALSCIMNYVLTDDTRLDSALQSGLIPVLLGIVSGHVLRMGQSVDETSFLSSHHMVSTALQAVLFIAEVQPPSLVTDSVNDTVTAALVQVISNDSDDTAAKRAFILLQLCEAAAVHHVLHCITRVCASLGTRNTLPAALTLPVEMTALLDITPADHLSGQQAEAACCWLEKALVVVNALVFTSHTATQWLTCQSDWYAGLAPLAQVMIANVGPREVLSAALLCANLAVCEPTKLSQEAARMKLVPLIAFILTSISSAAPATHDSDEEVEEARAILLQLCTLLVRGHLANCAAFVCHGEDALQMVAQLATSTSPLQDMATELFLELAEGAVAVMLQAEAPGATQPASVLTGLLDAFQSGGYTSPLQAIASRAEVSSDAKSARAVQALHLLERPTHAQRGVPHARHHGRASSSDDSSR